MEPLDVTATICNYNGEPYLHGCIESLLAQTRPPRHIVLYDNASTDGSLDLVRREFPTVTIVEMGGNEGPCPVRNRGLEEASTPWVLQVDVDTALEPDCLEKLWAEIGAGSDGEPVAAVMPRAVFSSEPDRIHYDGGYFHPVGIMTLRHFFAPVPAAESPEPVAVDAFISMAVLLHRERTLEVGGYDPAYFILFEDHCLSYRLRARGYGIRLVPSARVLHREGTAGISFREGTQYPTRRVFLHSRNRWMLLARNHSLAALLLAIPALLAYEIVWFGFALQQRALGSWFRGKWDCLRRLPAILRARRSVQRTRRISDRVLLRPRSLTHAPMVNQGGFRRLVEASLDWFLKTWWRLVRPLVP